MDIYPDIAANAPIINLNIELIEKIVQIENENEQGEKAILNELKNTSRKMMLEEWQSWQGLKPTTLHTMVDGNRQKGAGQRMNVYTNQIMGI